MTKMPRDNLVAEACVRSLANDASVDVQSVVEIQVFAESEAVVPSIVSAHRGHLDALALRHVNHDVVLHKLHAPAGAIERAIFDVFERERYESIGCNEFAGVQKNLDARFILPGESASDVAESVGNARSKATIERLLQAAHVMCRSALRQHPAVQPTVVHNTEYATLWAVFGDHLDEVAEVIHDQSIFALKVLTLLEQWQRVSATGEEDGHPLQGLSDDAHAVDQPPPEDAEAEEFDTDDESGSADQVEDDNDAAREGEQVTSEADSESQDGDAMVEQQVDEAPGSGRDPIIQISAQAADYKAYTTEFDEICQAADFADQEALTRWRLQLDDHIDVHSRLIRRLASKLQRVLLARQRRHWQFDMEEGHLDTARLSRIVSEPLVPLTFKCESEAPMRDTAITLLIDNSRSMLGRPIMIAAAATDILARTLERCGVSVEILGFTTVHLHGGRSTELWESRGKPEDPGRLNDLRHIVYKSANTSYRSSRRQLGLMLDNDILKQNIDGEALMWAHQRLLKRPEERRILMMISDGAPVETSTLCANSGDYLSAHLQSVITNIERAGAVELLAIGIGHDVSRYYSQALSVYDVRQLGAAMLNKLESLLRKAA